MFGLFIGFIIIQRIIELVIAKRNETWIKELGGIEVGQLHYRFMVMIHVCFFITFISEVLIFHKGISHWWPFLLMLFALTQIGRGWVIFTLGRYWNTKILILPQAKVVKKGPYRFLKHPNYCIVTLEFIIVPFMFRAYMTALIFTLLNILILSIRIPAEERVLAQQTEYAEVFMGKNRFLPTIMKRT